MMRFLNICLIAVPLLQTSCSGQNMMMEYLEVPASYGYDPMSRVETVYEFEKFDAELVIQRNGPDTWQRVVKTFPKEYDGQLPAVIVPFYFPEAMLGVELEGGAKLQKYEGIEMMAHLTARGFACISADAYHLTYLQSDKSRDAFSRWSDAGDALVLSYPQWCGMGKLMADTRILIDLLEADSRIDNDRIGIAGHSLGGKMAFYTGCLDDRIKVVVASDFGFLWEQSNWEKNWYWGEKLDTLKSAGLSNVDILTASGGKPFFLIAGQYDNDGSLAAMKQAGGYADCPENLGFLNHASGHRPPMWALETGYCFLEKYLK